MAQPCGKCSDVLDAVFNEHIKCLKKLLQDGCKMDEKDMRSATALEHATCIPDHKMVALLLKAGADVNHADYLGRTAIFGTDHKCMRLLLKAGADVHVTIDDPISEDFYGDTPLHYAAEMGKYKCVDMLIRAGADVNVTNSQGNTVLMRAATSTDGTVRCVRKLLQLGVLINLVNNTGQNALTKCLQERKAASKYKERQMFLFAAGEKLNEKLNDIPDYLKDPDLRLKHLCRKAIRKLLVEQNPQRHLFDRIPKLGLPSILDSYLLYDFSLENDQDESDDESETTDDDDQSDDDQDNSRSEEKKE